MQHKLLGPVMCMFWRLPQTPCGFGVWLGGLIERYVGANKSECAGRLTERMTPPFQGKSLIVSILDSDCDACKPLGVS